MWPVSGRGTGTVREVHDNTLAELYTGLRDFLRSFREVNKKHLHQYVAMFKWGDNGKQATPSFL
jgi:hypothetical protein